MDELQEKVSLILKDLTDQMIDFASQGQFEVAYLLMEQYIKLSPHSIDRYCLEAMINVQEGKLESAEQLIKEGLSYHPMSFDLLYNLGYVFEEKKEFFEAYHFYMRARYISSTQEEKDNIAKALQGLVKVFSGTIEESDDEISNIVIAEGIQIVLKTTIEELLKSKKMLGTIEKYIAKDTSSVLDIGFGDGMISKNLNYYGYDVTAVSPHRDSILNVIVNEWQDNLLQPEQKVAKFYQEQVDINWMRQIPSFDIIIAISNNNLSIFNADQNNKEEMLELLLDKVRSQLFIKVSSKESSSDFNKEDIAKLAQKYHLDVKVIAKDDGGYELCLIEKQANIRPFNIPSPLEIAKSESLILEVEVNKCVDSYGAGYVDDWHHFVEFLKEYEENPEISYQDSILKGYYDEFKPRHLEEALFNALGRASKLNRGWIEYPWIHDKNQKVVFGNKLKDTRPGGNHNFGPNTEEFGTNEFNRLLVLYNLLKKNDYHPEIFTDGYVSGYLLIKEDDYRFVVTEGQHRIACLAALGYNKIRCRFSTRSEYPKIVDYKNIKKWPQVENGVYSRNLAQRVFNRFFEDGVGRDRMGLD